MTERTKGILRSVVTLIGSIAVLISFGAALGSVHDEVKNKATKQELNIVIFRFEAESIRNQAFKDRVIERLDEIAVTTGKTEKRLQDIWCEGKPAGCN